jgi:hypothetical protein
MLKKYNILQLIKVKNDYPEVNLVIFGGAEAPAVKSTHALYSRIFSPNQNSDLQVADELATSGIPLIFTAARGAPTAWEKKDVLVGLPLTASPVQVLAAANVTFALALPYDCKFSSRPHQPPPPAKSYIPVSETNFFKPSGLASPKPRHRSILGSQRRGSVATARHRPGVREDRRYSGAVVGEQDPKSGLCHL